MLIQFGLADYSETDNCRVAIPSGGTCTVSVTATPQALGDRSTQMTVTFDSALAQRISIALTSQFPITVGAPSVTFSDPTLVGAYSGQQYLSLSNYGYTPVIYSLSISGDFVVQNTCSNPMTGFTGCSLSVVFHPRKSGSQQGTLTITVPGVSPVYQVPLTATGFNIAASPARPSRPSRIPLTSSVQTTQPPSVVLPPRVVLPARVVTPKTRTSLLRGSSSIRRLKQRRVADPH